MKRTFTKILFAAFTFISLQSFAQTVLAPGDIAIVAYQYITNSPDRFAFIPLVDLQANTTITFTDNAFKAATNALGTTEDTMIWNSGSNLILAGTVITIAADTNAGAVLPICSHGSGNNELDGLSSGGDQIIAFQGVSSQNPTFLTALTSNTFLTTGATTSNTSYVPTGLTNQLTAIDFPNNRTAGYYDCANNITSGNRAALLASINDSSNWIRATVIQTWPTCNYSIVTDVKQIKEASLKAFPNPSTTGVFTLSKNTNVQVYNMVGVNVLNVTNTNTIDLSGFGAGVYFVKTNNNEIIKLVKNN